jgi:hypothetical protein
VDAVDGKEEVTLHGLLAGYQPDSGAVEPGASDGGFFDADLSVTEGQTRRLILTDAGAWHWENVTLPFGVRFAPFRLTLPTAAPVSAVARFGPEGIEGKLSGPFEDVGDALLETPNGHNLAVRLGPDGRFTARAGDALPRGDYLAGAVLTDRQQRRQDVYREFLKQPGKAVAEGRTVLLAWAKPMDVPFRFGPEPRTVGDALLVVPLRLERPAPGERITIPGPLLPYQRILGRAPSRPTFESTEASEMHLRFQLPPEVLPFRVERARLFARIEAPGRPVTVAGRAGGQLVELHRVESPLDPVRVEIADERYLQLDEDGGLHLDVNFGEPAGDGARRDHLLRWGQKWKIDYLELEVSGRAEG